MKKITILAVAALAISFASCKKDRVCSCTQTDTTTYSGISMPAQTNTSTDNTTYTKVTKKAAKVNCISIKGTTTYDIGAGASATTVFESKCTLS